MTNLYAHGYLNAGIRLAARIVGSVEQHVTDYPSPFNGRRWIFRYVPLTGAFDPVLGFPPAPSSPFPYGYNVLPP